MLQPQEKYTVHFIQNYLNSDELHLKEYLLNVLTKTLKEKPR